MALFCDGANGVAAVAVAVHEQAEAAAVEVEAARAAAVVLAQRARPVAAERAKVVDLLPVAAARSGKKNTLTVLTGDPTAIDFFLGSPAPSAFIQEFLSLIKSGKTPCTAPMGTGDIVLCTTDVLT